MKRFQVCLIAAALIGLPAVAWAQSGGQCDAWVKRTLAPSGCWEVVYLTGLTPVAPGTPLPAPRRPPPAGYSVAAGWAGLQTLEQCKAGTANMARVAQNQYPATTCVAVFHDGVKLYSRP